MPLNTMMKRPVLSGLLLLSASHILSAQAITIEERPLLGASTSMAVTAAPAASVNAPVVTAVEPENAASAPSVETNTGPIIIDEPLQSQAIDMNQPVASATKDNAWEMYQQLQQLQQEVMSLRGTVDEQAHLIERLRNDQRTHYTDLDQRINTVIDKSLAAPKPTPSQTASNTSTATSQTPAVAPKPQTAASIEDEKKAYLDAYRVFSDKGPDQAIAPMQAFLKKFPDGTFTANAHYWLGEFFLAASKPNLWGAKQNFQAVVSKFPEDSKAAASLYKLGTIAELEKKMDEAKKYMQELLKKYPDSAEAGLAKNFLK